MTLSNLPKFGRPPVVEAFCGISFQEITKLHAPQLGRFWEAIRKEFPKIDTQPPLAPVMPFAQTIQFFVPIGPIQFRSWFMSENSAMLVQVQRDRLVVNWRKNGDDHLYPSFGVLRQHFVDVFEKFETFLKDELGEVLDLTGVEFGYINVIPLGKEMTSTSELASILPMFDWKANLLEAGFDSLNSVNFQAQFAMNGFEGQMSLAVQSAQMPLDGRAAIRLDLTSRWLKPGIGREQVLPWLDRAHAQSVKSFASVTSSEMHSKWGRTQ